MTLPVAGLPETSDARLEACLARIEARDGFPALTQRIQELTAVLGDEDASVQRLANIVLRDYGLTLRVIRAANSFHYNRSGCPVVTATHAMVLLGVRAVRDLVSGIVIFEHCQRHSPGLKHLMRSRCSQPITRASSPCASDWHGPRKRTCGACSATSAR